MIEVRFHGRGGQGAVTAAELLAEAAISTGMYAQAFPNFGAERRGAPVTAFLRISGSPIYCRERIDTPDVVVVLDPTLIGMVDVTYGLPAGKIVVANAASQQVDITKNIDRCYDLGLVNASRIAMETLGVPITNTAIIGALVRTAHLVSLDALEAPVKKRFGRLAKKNLVAMKKAFDETQLTKAASYTRAALEQTKNEQWETTLRKEALQPWQDVEISCDVHRPGSCKEFQTGNWRTSGRPVIDKEACIACGICWIMCPEIAFSMNEDGEVLWNGLYCKGCGICANICPKQAIAMEEE